MGKEKTEPRSRARRRRGFTLMELLLVLTLAALVLAFGAPSFREFRRNARLTGIANDLLTSLQLARTTAIERQVPVSICPTVNPRAAEPLCSGGTFTGWIVFVDPDGDCRRGDPMTAPLLGRGGVGDATVSAVANGTCVSFAPTGYLRNAPVEVTATQLLFCDERGIEPRPDGLSPGRGLALLPTGRAHITREAANIASWGLECPD